MATGAGELVWWSHYQGWTAYLPHTGWLGLPYTWQVKNNNNNMTKQDIFMLDKGEPMEKKKKTKNLHCFKYCIVICTAMGVENEI